MELKASMLASSGNNQGMRIILDGIESSTSTSIPAVFKNWIILDGIESLYNSLIGDMGWWMR